MTRQYIGARYVPKFYENSDGTAAWRSGVIYEPLTIVTYNGNSYTSKRAVPAEIGNPSDNPVYWAATGLYNEQVEALRELVNTFDSRITDVNDRVSDVEEEISAMDDHRYVVVSDSYGLVRGDVTPWTELLRPVLGAATSDYYIIAEGSMGFNRPGSSGHTVQTLLQASIASIANPETITDIIFGLGANDALAEASDGLGAAIKQTIQYTKTAFPAAKIHIGFIGNQVGKNSVSLRLYCNAVRIYQEIAGSEGVSYIRGAEYVMHDLDNMQSDGVHPSANGAAALADFMAAYLGGDAYNYKKYKEAAITSTTFSGATLKTCIDGPVTNMNIYLGRSTDSVTLSQGGTEIGEFTTMPVYSEGGYTAYFWVSLYDDTANDYRQCPAYIYGKKLFIIGNKAGGMTVPNNTASFSGTLTLPTLCV